ncbi:MAG: hypothetical protein H7Z74_06455 [Anaerolineae bacterium]|nr:hypothetical protein [Gemmatimonadaceae bacterium]
MADAEAFTYRNARSGSLTAGFALAIAVETVVVHLWLVSRHPVWAWSLTTLSAITLAWLALDYRAMGRGSVLVQADALDVVIGRRTAFRIPRTQVVTARAASWRDEPDTPNPNYLNATAPADPNVILSIAPPVHLPLVGRLVTRSITSLGIRLDDPEGFLAALLHKE